MESIIYSTATEIAAAIRDKQISSEEATQAHLDRIEEVNPKLNAVVLFAAKSAIKAAQRADEAVANGDELGPLHGVPVTIKDAYEVAKMVSTGGTLGRKNYAPETDATAVSRLRKAGVVIMGKTNLPEISMGFESSNLVYGRTNNPFDLGRTPGGSSGGEASIIAAGGSPLGIGSDAGGSIRWPAHCTGIAGLKPTTGRIPKTGHWPLFAGVYSLVTQPGPMARSVRDLVTTLKVLSGPDGIDPNTMPVALGDPDAVDLGKLRIAFHTSNGVSIPTPEIQSAVRTAVGLLKGKVAKVKEDMPGALETTPGLHAALMGADAGQVAQQILREAGSPEMDPDLKARIAMMPSEPMPVTELLGTLVDLEDYRRKMMSFMRGYDVMIGPAAPVPAALHHHGYDGFPESGSYSHAYNLAGWPALVIRGGTSPEGMPLGIQVIASPWREDLVLAVGLFLQEALGEFPRPNI